MEKLKSQINNEENINIENTVKKNKSEYLKWVF
jgi:hypothetical protein